MPLEAPDVVVGAVDVDGTQLLGAAAVVWQLKGHSAALALLLVLIVTFVTQRS
jgi:hypothetical protein